MLGAGPKGNTGATGPSSLINGYKGASFDKIRDCCHWKADGELDCILWPFSVAACTHVSCDEISNRVGWSVNEFNSNGNWTSVSSGSCP